MNAKRTQEIIDLLTKRHTDYVMELYAPHEAEVRKINNLIDELENQVSISNHEFNSLLIHSLESKFNLGFNETNTNELAELILKISKNHK